MKFLKAIYSFLEEIGRVKAATYFARSGEHEKALKLYSTK
jgi:hypothetical protein